MLKYVSSYLFVKMIEISLENPGFRHYIKYMPQVLRVGNSMLTIYVINNSYV